MQIYLSDTHFSDATIGDKSNVPGRAFTYLQDDLLALIEHPETDIREVEIILLGDVFDTLRSADWSQGGPMPWGAHDQALEDRVTSILERAIAANTEALATLRSLKEDLKTNSVNEVRITYIPGNHDRSVNWFAGARTLAAQALGLDADAPFPTELGSRDYRVIARHGDIHDVTNWSGSYDASCLGDAVVLKLLNTFPVQLEQALDAEDPAAAWIFERAAELDHLRPMQAIPAWINALLADVAAREPDRAAELGGAVRNAWAHSVDTLLDDPFVKSLDHLWNPFEPVDALKLLLRVPLGLTEQLGKIVTKLNLAQGVGNVFSNAAAKEPALLRGDADFVIYGHTHAALQFPLDASRGRSQIYFNTGAWRKTINETMSVKSADRRFIAWQIMAYTVLYKPGENRDYRYETWIGTRG